MNTVNNTNTDNNPTWRVCGGDARPYDPADMARVLADHGPVDFAAVYRALTAEGLRPWRGTADGHDAVRVICLGYDVRVVTP